MSLKSTVSKAILFTIGVSAISTAITVVQTDLKTGVFLFAMGVILIVLFVLLVDYQAMEAGRKEAEKTAEKEAKKWVKKTS